MQRVVNLCVCAIVAVTGCGQVPVVAGAQDAAARAAPFPDLAPLEPLLAQSTQIAPQITPASTAATQARAADLQRRAANLRGPVIDSATRSRMQGAIQRAALR